MEDKELSWEEIPPVWRVIWTVLIVSGLVWIAALILQGKPDKYTIIQTIILALTLIVVVWYASVTSKMQKASQRQLEISREQVDSYKLSIAADWILKLDDQFDGEDLTKARRAISVFFLNFRGESEPPNISQESFDRQYNSTLNAL